jgi:hypothetical protein
MSRKFFNRAAPRYNIAMRYHEFKDAIERELRSHPAGLTWAQLKQNLDLPYATACPDWTARLEDEIALTRSPGPSRAYVWRVPRKSKRTRAISV